MFAYTIVKIGIMSISKCKLNLLIDVVLVLLLMAMSGLGLLIKYVLVPGFKRNVLYGSEVELYFMGLDRHQWGTVHLWVGFAFLLLILIHVILHWKMIGCIFRRMVVNRVARIALVVSLVLLMLLLGLAPLFLKPRIVHNSVQHSQHRNIKTEPGIITESTFKVQLNHETKRHAGRNKTHSTHKTLHEWGSTGTMTLAEVAAKYDIPVEKLAKALGVPSAMSTQKIGRLKRAYGFETETLKNEIIQILNNQ